MKKAISFDQWTPRLEGIWAIHAPSVGQFEQQLIRATRDVSLVEMRKAFAARQQATYGLRSGTAVIPIQGMISKYPSLLAMLFDLPTQTTADYARMVNEAAADDAVNAILLIIDSPGGTVAGTSDLAEAVWNARMAKPCVAYASDMCASAAYYVASQADAVYADVDAMVGAIGVYYVVADTSKLAEDVGVKVHVVRAGEFKGAGESGTPVTDAQLADFQREVNQLNEPFVAAVMRGRNMSTQQVQALNDGRVHIGKHAQAMGLIDGIKSLDQVTKEMSDLSMGRNRMLALSWKRQAVASGA